MKINSIKKQARAQVSNNNILYIKISLMRVISNLIFVVVGLPLLLQMLQYEATRGQSVSFATPNTFAFPLIVALYASINVITQGLIIAHMSANGAKTNITREFTTSGTRWSFTGAMVIVKQVLYSLVSIIPFIIYGILRSNGHDFTSIIWFGYIIGFVAFYLAPTRYYFAVAQSVINVSDTKQAIKESKALTKGRYLEITKLRLSFLLWDIINVLTCGVFSIYLIPYKLATMLEYRKEISQ